MKRTSMRKPAPPRRPAAPLTPLSRPVRQAVIGDEVMATPKGVKAKPGKGAPNAVEQRWMDAIVRHGCVACLQGPFPPLPAEVHHILRGGRRLGHLYTLPLCSGHHRDGAGSPGLLARHPYKARFEATFGTELELLAELQVELGIFDAVLP